MFNKRYRIVSLHRFAMFLAILTVLIAISFFIMSELISAEGLSEVEYRNVVVESGDTLWSIASESRADNPDTDVRDIILHISNINNISAEQLRAGDVIQVPIGL